MQECRTCICNHLRTKIMMLLTLNKRTLSMHTHHTSVNMHSQPLAATTVGTVGKVVCRSSKNIREVEQVCASDTNAHDAFLGAVHNLSNGIVNSTGFTDVLVNGISVSFRIDTGADVSVLPRHIYDKHLSHVELIGLPSTTKLFGPDKKQLDVDGYITCELKRNNKCATTQLYVMQSSRPLLSKDSSTALGVIVFINGVEHSKYPELFRGLGEMPQQYSIKLVEDAVPNAVCTPRRVPLPLMAKVKEELDRLVKFKVIRQITEPTDWCAPIVVVPKRESHAIRMCVDFTELNKFVKRERHILPAVDHNGADVRINNLHQVS